MKWLTTILALYLLGLSLWPCADQELPIPRRGRTVVFTKVDRPSTSSSHEHHDQCTPFCSCTCCAATATFQPYFSYTPTISVAVAIALVANFRYTSPHWADTLAAIWQPPKLYI